MILFLELTNQHFKTDSSGFADKGDIGNERNSVDKKKKKESKMNQFHVDEDEEIKRAIELSKQTALEEEHSRITALKKESVIEPKK